MSVQPQVQDVEGKLPPKVPVVVKVPMTPYQSAVYKWVKVGKSRRCGVKQTLAWLLAGKCWGT